MGRKYIRTCCHIRDSEGLEVVGVEHRAKHLAIRTGLGVLTCPSTPSDHRWEKNLRAIARRMRR